MKKLLQLFPPLLVGMLLFAQLIELFLNYELYDSRELAILFCWIPLLIIPYIYTQKKGFYYIAITICFVESFASLCHWILLKGPPTATSLFVISNTNYNEAKEFMELKFTMMFLFLVAYILLFIITLKKPPALASYPKQNYFILAVLLFSVIFVVENAMNGRFVRKGLPQTIKTLISFYDEWGAYRSLQNRDVRSIKTVTNYNSEEERVFVLIIGESCNRNHLSVYNYQRKTTPRLEKRNDLIVYNNVVSAYSNTLSSVLALLTESNLENQKSIDQSISLIDVFHSSGYKTYWISNQPPLGIWDNSVSHLAQTSDITTFVNIASNSSMESTYTPSLDAKLFGPFAAALKESSKHKFIVIHLMGSHSSYSKRYPSEFNIFTDHDHEKAQTINEYDNSILYTDFIVDSLINMVNTYSSHHNKSVCSAIYLSDHGENVYDEQDYAGHDYSGTMPKANVEIPFMVWLSPSYQFIHKEKTALIASASDKPFVSDDLFHAIIDLNHIECAYHEKERSIFHPTFNHQRKRILEDKKDYDLK